MLPTGDLEAAAKWAASAMGGAGARVVGVTSLRPGGSPWLLEVMAADRVTRAIMKTGSAEMAAELATEAAALGLAETHNLPAPRLLAADLEGQDAGCIAVLMTHLDGTDRIPVDLDVGRLRAAGAAAAAIHRVSLTATADLPLRHRHMPWINLSDDRLRGESPSTKLLERGDRFVNEAQPPAHATVFVHGDLWMGNMLWDAGTYIGTIDWEGAGAGSYGVDLGSLRLDAALLHGPDAPDEVLAGWEDATGDAAHGVAYWDLVAVLNTPADMTAFTPTIHQAGRGDLGGRQLTTRRDAFLTAALDRLL